MTNQTHGYLGTMTATADCQLCGSMEPPSYRTFFELTPVAKNNKTISAKVNGKIMHWSFEWLHDRATYVKMWTNDSPEQRYVGIFDYQKNVVHEAPASINKTSEYFIMTNIMLDKFVKNDLKYIFDAIL